MLYFIVIDTFNCCGSGDGDGDGGGDGSGDGDGDGGNGIACVRNFTLVIIVSCFRFL